MAIIRPGFMPKAPGWVRWPAYLATFGIYWAGLCLLAGVIATALAPTNDGAVGMARSLMTFWMIWNWFGWPPEAATASERHAPVRPKPDMRDLRRLIFTATAIVLGIVVIGSIVILLESALGLQSAR